jgi:hypothetical protein
VRAVRTDLAQLRVAAADLIFLHDPGLVNGTAVTAALWQGMQDANRTRLPPAWRTRARTSAPRRSCSVPTEEMVGVGGRGGRASRGGGGGRPRASWPSVRTLSRTPRRGYRNLEE